ncbi:MAG: hypothetical protein M5U26_05715 [Planctomycetota bacterium]|nr:hypothetical protein [Planctomycetota bacterium]
MPRRLLIITKDPEFDERGEVVLGQCEPFTSGWKLILVGADRKHEELLAGTYTDLRRIQESCASIEEVEKVRKRVEEMRALLNSSVTETVAVDFRTQDEAGESTKIMEPTQTGMLAAVPEGLNKASEERYFELERKDGVILALLADPDRASDLPALNRNLKYLLETQPRAIILDLSRIQNLASRVVNELVNFRDACTEQEVGFGLCNLRKSVQRLFESLETENPPRVYESSEAALAGLPPQK